MDIVVTCPAVQLPHGTIQYTKQPINERYPVNTTLTFSCDYTYVAHSQTIVLIYRVRATCLPTGRWSRDVPHCKDSNKIYIPQILFHSVFSIA